MKRVNSVLIFSSLIFLLLAIFVLLIGYDKPVVFSDPNLEQAIREELNHHYKPIFRSQLLGFTELDLSSKNIQDLSGIEHIRNLETLNLRWNAIDDVSSLSTLWKLAVLNLGYNRLGDLKSSHFDTLRNLNIVSLNLDHNRIIAEESKEIRLSNIETLKKFTSLEHLSLEENQITDISPLTNLHNLKSLNLSGNPLKNLRGLDKLIRIEELNLRENHLEDISALKDLTNLKYLNLHSNPNIEDLSPISYLVNLETLILRNIPIGDQITILDELTNLQRLNIRNCDVTDISIIAKIMSKGALQDNPEKNIEAYLDILENDFPEDPYALCAFNPYWDNIHTAYPSSLNGSILEPPSYSHEAGFYNDSFYLTLHTESKDSSIFFSLDGSVPTENAELYTGPILIPSKAFTDTQTMQATIIRARVIENNGFNNSPIITKSYFISPNIQNVFTLPVISLVTDPENFYNSEFGIYTIDNYRRRGKKWERPLSLEFFESNAELSRVSNVLVRLHGQTSRNASQKSLRIYGENNYDQFNSIDFPFFPDLKATGTGESIDRFKTLILRNSGNDWNRTMFRDALIQSLVAFTNLDTQAYRPVNVFLNGSYWGILNIRERMDEYYIANHYGIEANDVLIYEVSTYEDFYGQNRQENEFLSLLDYIRNQDCLDPNLYKTIEQNIDIQNFLDNQIIYLYAHNEDWLQNNVKFWKMDVANPSPDAPYGQDGRWRWMVVDLDFGFTDYSTNFFPRMSLDTDETLIMSTLLKNPEYRNIFINRFNDLLNTAFLPSRVIEEIDLFELALENDIEKHINRWGVMNGSLEQWHANIDVMREFAIQRPMYVRQQMSEEFGLSEVIEITVKTNIKEGHIKINSINIIESTPGINDPSLWSGSYFKDLPITLTAVPKQGYRFSHWEGVSTNDAENASIELIPTGDMTIIAIFEKITSN